MAEITRPMIGSASGESEHNTDGSDHDGEGRESIGAGVHAVGDERRRSDSSADSDAVDRDRFIADEADGAGGHQPAEVLDGLRVQQTIDRLPGRNRG